MHTTPRNHCTAPARPHLANTRQTRRRLTSVALAAALGALAASPLQAADLTWVGRGGGSWSDAANWALPGGQPARPTANDLLIFSAPTGSFSVVDFFTAPAGLLFQAGAGASTIIGIDIAIGARGITNLSNERQTIKAGLRAQGQQTWDGGSAGILYRPDFDSQRFNPPGQGGPVTDGASLSLARNVTVEQSAFALKLGVLGSAQLTVLDGSSVSAQSITLGEGSFAQGVLSVRGNTSSASAVADLVVGNWGAGTLNVEGGALVSSGGQGALGSIDDVTGRGVATVTGAGSHWSIGLDLLASNGALSVADGGLVTARNGVIGGTWGRSAHITVGGADSRLSFAESLAVGLGRVGTLSVLDGGTVRTRALAIGAYGVVNLQGGTLQLESSNMAVTPDNFVWAGGTLQFTGEQGTRTGDGTFLGQRPILATGQRLVVDRQLVVDVDSSLTLDGGMADLGSLSVLGDVLVGDTSTLAVTGGLDNQGTLTVLDGGTVRTGHLALGASGLLSLQGGTLQVATAANAGTAANFNWYAGTLQYLGSTSTGDGLLLGRSTDLVAGQRLVVDGALTVGLDHELKLFGGRAEVGALVLQGSMAVNALSTLAVGSGGMDNRGALQLNGGTLSGAGSLVNNAVMGGHGVIAGGGSFINNGLFESSGGRLELATLGENINNGSWDMLSGRGLVLSGGNLVNMGAMTLNGDTVSGTATLINDTAGTLSGRGVISAPFFTAGRLVVGAGSLRIDRASFDNTGRIVLGSATATLSGGAVYNRGRIEGQGQINNAISNTGTVAALGAGTTLTLGQVDNLNYGGAAIGSLVAGSGATLVVSAGLGQNRGTIRLAGGSFDNNGHGLENAAMGVISGFGTLSAGSVRNQGRMLLSGGVSEVHAEVLNAAGGGGLAAGQIILSGNSNTTFYGTVDVESGAELRVSTGSVATFFGLVQQRTGARFTGAGAKRFEGGVSVGASPGMVRDEGDVEFGDGNFYLAEIGGTTACTLACGTDDAFKNSSFDKYIVDGSLSLAGTLTLVSWNGFVAQSGQHFDLLDWGSLSGQFDSIDASGFKLAAGTQLDFSQLYTTGEVLVTTSAVPEPATTALWLAGLVGMGVVARRRRCAPGMDQACV